VRDGIVYFNGFEDAVLAVPRGGGPVTTLAPSQDGAGISHLAVDATNVYFTWFDFDATAGAIKTVPRGGGAVTTLATTGSAMPWRLAVDASSVYWTEGGGGVKKVPLAGGAVVTVADRPGPILSFAKPPIAVDASNLYFVEMSSDGARAIALRQMPLAGGPATTLVDVDVLGLTVDATDVYFVADSAGKMELGRVPIGGGPVTTLLRDASIGAPVLSGGAIYFAYTPRIFDAAGFFEGYVMKVQNDGTGLGRVTGVQHGVPEAVTVAEGAVFWSSRNDQTLFALALDACSGGVCR
jgi:hypothetical protein